MKFKIGDKVRRINHNNGVVNGRELVVGDIGRVVGINGKWITIKVANTIYSGNDPKNLELVTEHKFEVGDMVIGNDPYRYAYINKGWIGEVKKVHSNGCIDLYGKRVSSSDYMTFTYLEPEYFDLYTQKSEKIVITHDGKTTTATLYRENGSKEVATAKCSPEDTFDFNFGAKLAMERLMKKVEPADPVVEWRVVNRKPRVGDYIRLRTNGGYTFSEPGDILKVDEVGGGTIVGVYGKNHPRDTNNPEHTWNYVGREYEVVEKVTTTEPKKPEPPKYFTGKVICIKNSINDGEFTVGKVYEIKDGNFTDNFGRIRPNTYGRDRVKTLSDLENKYYRTWYYKFIPIVE